MPTALVLSAGGMFAAWEAGFWKVLSRRLKPDLVVGASAGAWNGWAIAGGCPPDELIENWLHPRIGGIMRLGLHPTGILRPEALHGEARRLFERFRPRIDFALTMVEVPRLRVRIVAGAEVGWEHLAATCSIPCAFPPVPIGGRRYVDGGLAGALPVWVAEALGATRAIRAGRDSGFAGPLVLFELARWRMARLGTPRRRALSQAGARRIARGERQAGVKSVACRVCDAAITWISPERRRPKRPSRESDFHLPPGTPLLFPPRA